MLYLYICNECSSQFSSHIWTKLKEKKCPLCKGDQFRKYEIGPGEYDGDDIRGCDELWYARAKREGLLIEGA